MLKIFNLITLSFFLCFLFAPTLSFALNKDLNTAMIIVAEEEENHSKTKSPNNNLSEEEEKEVHYNFSNPFENILTKNGLWSNELICCNHTIKDNLVFKIPLPPPEQHL